ncbi:MULTISPECIES: hypothetical protein [unclassified Moorena]|nr:MULTISPECIES: hypothetical protein [unclassified Moorena]NEO16740.1 hypothetical protein [Moorena sp. SIO3E8]NEQ03275.1 hypothetical protein [Moorena sp. SIO3F7]
MIIFAPCSLLPVPCSLFPAPCSLLPAPFQAKDYLLNHTSLAMYCKYVLS